MPVMPLILAAFLAPAAPAPAPPPPASAAIVVTGQRLQDTQAALRACIARHCPTDEDIDATLAHAQNQLEAGQYHEARTTLLKSLGRNKKQVKQYPVAVSDLYRANGKVAAHLGLDQDYLSSTLSVAEALKAGLPADDYRVFIARMEIAAMMGRLRGHEAARRAYADLAGDARRSGRPDIAAMAELRSILNHYPPEMRASRIRAIAESPDPELRAAVLEARLALVNLARASGDKTQVALLMRELSSLNGKRPILIHAPAYETIVHEREPEQTINNFATMREINSPVTQLTNVGAFSTSRRIPDNFEDKWLDVGFWITPQGKVSDLRVLRKKGDVAWAGPLLRSIAGRLYTPGNGRAIDSYRVERYTYTASLGTATGTHLAQRAPQARIEFMDLSTDGLATPD